MAVRARATPVDLEAREHVSRPCAHERLRGCSARLRATPTLERLADEEPVPRLQRRDRSNQHPDALAVPLARGARPGAYAVWAHNRRGEDTRPPVEDVGRHHVHEKGCPSQTHGGAKHAHHHAHPASGKRVGVQVIDGQRRRAQNDGALFRTLRGGRRRLVWDGPPRRCARDLDDQQ